MPEKFSASRASKFRNCHASADLAAAIPNWKPPIENPTEDNAANRGTSMHEVFARMMELPKADMFRMIEAFDYVAEVRSRRRFKVLVEVTECADWLPSMPHTTADLVLYLSNELHVFDLKTGKIPVDPYQNDQLLFYAATYLKYAPNVREVHLHIVQPWAGLMEQWVIPTDDLLIWMEETSIHDLQILDGDTTFMPGDHCLFCPANPHSRSAKGRPLCPAMMQMLYPVPVVDDGDVLAAAAEEE